MLNMELRILPPVAFLIAALSMLLVAQFSPALAISPWLRFGVAIGLAFAGFGTVLSAFLSFRKRRTTYHPVRIEKASTLLTDGAFAYSRNPMYLGMAAVLMAWTIALASPLAALGPLGFVLYITRYQILPEERALAAKFGSAFADYRTRVRRWI
jgi:protein-S-isoprenylcysteine O-methyltransferase Ste14